MSDVRVLLDLADLVWAAAEQTVSIGSEAIRARGRFNLALSGGSTPLPMFALLALPEWRVRLDWTRTHVYWSDERCVPPDHNASNYRMAHNALLEPVGVPEGNIHRMRGEIEPAQAADEYEALITGVDFDLIFLGMGDDGHTASLFPGTAAVHEGSRLVMAHYVPKVDQWRLTMTPVAINAAANVILLVSGATKADTLRQALRGPYQPDVLPVQVVRPTNGRLIWLVDQAAAAKLRE